MFRKIIPTLLAAFLCLLHLSGYVFAGTVDSATLTPSSGYFNSGNFIASFSALNNKTFTITSYEITIAYTGGVDISIISTSPTPATASVDTTAHTIHFLWNNVPVGSEMRAAIKISSPQNESAYQLTPSLSTYYNGKKKYTGTCNGAAIISSTKVDTAPIESTAGINSILIKWPQSTNVNAVGYRLYKRTSTTSYTLVNSFYVTELSYTDTNVQDSVAYYYKVAAVDQAGNELEMSPETAEMIQNPAVIRTYGAPAGSSRAIGDIDGNRMPDLIVGTPAPIDRKGAVLPGRVDIYMNNNISSTPDITLFGEHNNDQFGTALALIDMDNDGYDDIIIGAPGFDYYYNDPISSRLVGKVYVYAGGVSLSQSPVMTFRGQNEVCNCDCSGIYVYGEHLGQYVASIGDVNGDGFKDAAIGTEWGGTGRRGKIIFLFGGSGIVSGSYQVTGLQCEDNMGFSVSSVGDVNGDGYDDVISISDDDPAKAWLIYGGTIPYFSGLVFFENISGYGSTSAGLDMNGDGFSDIAIGPGYTSAYLGSSYPDVQLDGTLGNPSTGSFNFIASIGDLNADGSKDLISHSTTSNNTVMFMGGTFIDNISDLTLQGLGPEDVKDIDGDGFKEIIGISAGAVTIYSLAPYRGLPYIVVTSPQNYDTVDTLNLIITGYVGSNTVKVLVKGQESELNQDGSFQAQVPVMLGRNVIEIIAEANDGRISKRKLYGTYGVPPLAVEITSPSEGATVCSPINVAGTVSGDPVQVRVSCWPSSTQYATATISGGNFQTAISSCSAGIITATATNSYGNTASHTIRVAYNSQCSLPLVTFGAQPGTIQKGESANLTWTTTYANSVTIDNGIGAVPLSGSTAISPTQTTTYTLSATGPGGTTTSLATVNVTTHTPTVAINAEPSSIYIGSSSTLTWTSTNATSATIDNGIGMVPVNSSLTVSPSETTTYTITVVGAYGTATASTTVTVSPPPPPTVNIGANPAIIETGQSSILTWSSTNATNATIDNGIGIVPVNGSITSHPSQTTTYTITVTGLGGTATASTIVTVVNPNVPKATISANPALVEAGQSSTLTWNSTNATSASIDNGIGTVPVNGTIAISPSQTTTYTITTVGLFGTATASFRVCLKEGTGYSYGDPTPAEQAFLEAVNRARLNPPAEAARLGIDLLEGIPEGMITDQPVQPLTFNAKLLQAAYLHSQDMMVNQYYNHVSLDGWTYVDRITWSGYDARTAAESLSSSFSTQSQEEVQTILSLHDHLFIDAGVEGRTHRVNILYPTLREMGVGFVSGAYETYPFTYLLTNDFGTSLGDNSPFILGVVYDDLNSDGIYTAGEGIGNVQIIIHESTTQTVTASAGGYALRLASGSYLVRAILPDGREASQYVALTDQNVKVDFLLSDFHFAPPSVNIASDPENIAPGGTSTLTWSSTNATSAAIDNGVGTVPVNGTTVVSPSQTTTYAITVTGPEGVDMAFVTVFVNNPSPVTLTITSPSEGQSVTGTNITVTGTVNNPSGNETGVSVNGVNAIVSGGNFIASNITLEEGANTIMATATDTAANTAEISIVVNATTTADSVKIIVLNNMGTSPFETILRVEANFPIQGTPVITPQGPGTVEFLESPGESEYAVRMTALGVYTFTVEVRDEAKNVYTNSVTVQVIDKTALDQLLRAKWEGMKAALMTGNISAALAYFSESSKENYGAMFTALSAQLPAIVSAMRDISFAYMDGDRFAVYRITREEIIRGQPHQITYHVYFILDGDGIWKIGWF